MRPVIRILLGLAAIAAIVVVLGVVIVFLPGGGCD
jgi:hypothetical protein